jgi:RsiW-degrading membrane proteinase PrsW (M82 family)
MLLYLTQALTLGVLSLVAYFGDQANTASAVSNSLLAWSSLFFALLFVPVIIFSVNRLRGRPGPAWLDGNLPLYKKVFLGLLIAWPLVVLLGWWVAGRPLASVFFLGLINILVAGVPVLEIYLLSRQKLQSGPQSRKWRIFSFSLGFTPWVVIIVEIIALLGAFLVVGLLLAYQISVYPALEYELQAMLSDVSTGLDLDTIIHLHGDVLNQPIVVFGLMAVIAGIMPLIEEIVKPLALWALAGHNLTDQEGFVAGLITGAAFTLMENLLYFSMAYSAEDWLFSAILRSTTGVLHMLGSGLVGLGLARTWRKGRWPFLALTLFSAIIFHSAWNAIALVASGAPVLLFGVAPTFWEQFVFLLPLLALLAAAITIMYFINRKLQKQQALQVQELAQDDSNLELHQVIDA